ncbi:MAG: DUF1800 family protein, partial [Acidobacteria bacterium]|nr:DUF1800 family protein [Acidobacteriota bacterium]
MISTIGRTVKVTSLTIIFALLSPIMAISVNAKNQPGRANRASLTEDQKIIHVLDRLGFGASPGDIEHVRSIGIDKYIDQQLNPGSIDDSALTARLRNYEVLNMETSDLFAKYPNPGALLRMLEGANQNVRQNQNSDSMAMENDEKNEKDLQKAR